MLLRGKTLLNFKSSSKPMMMSSCVTSHGFEMYDRMLRSDVEPVLFSLLFNSATWRGRRGEGGPGQGSMASCRFGDPEPNAISLSILKELVSGSDSVVWNYLLVCVGSGSSEIGFATHLYLVLLGMVEWALRQKYSITAFIMLEKTWKEINRSS